MTTNFYESVVFDDYLALAFWGSRHEAKKVIDLSLLIADVIEIPSSELAKLLKGLTPGGDLRGLCFCDGASNKSSGARPLFVDFLDSVFRFEEFRNRGQKKLVPFPTRNLSRLSAELSRLTMAEQWSDLGARPLRSNSVLHYQYRIRLAPAYPLVAAPLHIGICSKRSQIADLPPQRIDRLIEGFASWTAHIVHSIPEDCVRENLSEYLPGEFDEVVQETIHGLRKKRKTPRAPDYSPSSRNTLWRDWNAVFYATPNRKKFYTHATYSKSLEKQARESADPESLPDSHLTRKRFARLIERQGPVYDDDLLHKPLTRTTKNKPEPTVPPLYDVARANTNANDNDLFHKPLPRTTKNKPAPIIPPLYDSAHASMDANPSSAMPHILPRVTLGLAYRHIRHISKSSSGLNSKLFETLVGLLLHTGRPLDWLLQIRLGRGQDAPRMRFPIYERGSGTIFFMLDEYLGLPAALDPHEKKGADFNRVWSEHDQVYENVSLVHQLILPARLAGLFDSYLTYRDAAVNQTPLLAAGLGHKAQASPAWIGSGNGGLFIWDTTHFNDLISAMTDDIRKTIPRHRAITAPQITRSFQAYYSELGLRSEYRAAISGRIFSWDEMPLRYSLIKSHEVLAAHESLYERFNQSVLKEAGIGDAIFEFERTLPQPAQFGSWHVVREDVIQEIVSFLHNRIERPIEDEIIPDVFAKYNAQIRWVIVALGLLSGVRPFELARIRKRDLDFANGWISIRGKGRGREAAYRRLPIFRELIPALKRIVLDDAVNNSYVFGLYRANGEWFNLDTNELDKILANVSKRVWLNGAPDFYSLRHRFRSDMLEFGTPEHILNYLMGHEARGIETFNPYLERDISDLKQVYEIGAQKIAEKYEIAF